MLAKIIKDSLIDSAGVDAAKLDQPNLMVSDLALDSLGLVGMLFEVEDRFGFQIAKPMRFQTMSFNDMVAAIEAEVREHHGGALPDLQVLDSVGAAR